MSRKKPVSRDTRVQPPTVKMRPIIGLARAELLDVRPGWGGGRLRATAIELEPLGRAESEQLVEALATDGPLDADALEALLDKTEGNPLFVEETVRMLAECEGRPLSEFAERIPDTLQALIAARIDRLPPEERRCSSAPR